MLKKVLINIAIIFLCILGISAEGRAEEWSENNCIEVVSKYIYAYVNGDYKCAQNSADTIRSFNDYAALGFSNRRYFVPMYFYE